MHRAALGTVILLAIALLSGCAPSGSSYYSLEQQCLTNVATKLGIDIDSLEITDRKTTPGGAYDWYGTYPGGEFACAGDSETPTLHQVLTFEGNTGF